MEDKFASQYQLIDGILSIIFIDFVLLIWPTFIQQIPASATPCLHMPSVAMSENLVLEQIHGPFAEYHSLPMHVG